MKKGTNRLPNATRQTGGGSFVISHKPSKKLKTMGCVDRMDKCTSSKNVKLPKKLLDDGYTINFASVPRRLRSVPSAVTKKRYSEPSSPNVRNGISRCEMSFADGNKKPKLELDEQHSITKAEEEAIAGMLALDGNDNAYDVKFNNKVSKSEELVQKHAQIHDLNGSRNSVDVKKDSKDVTDGNNSRNRCCSHVYICRMIQNLELAKGKMVNSRQDSEMETTSEKVTKVNTGINLNEAITVSKTVSQDQLSGCVVQSYFGNPFCDPSQWSRPVFPKQQMWMSPFMYKPPQSGSYVQASLHNVLGSKQQQQLPFKMQFDHHPSSRYDEQGVLFRVDSPPTLKLAL